jgi:hypothetical protein
MAYGRPPDRPQLRFSSERSIIASIYTRIAIDVASFDIRHVRLDDQDRYLEDIQSGLNDCLTVEANLDQDARAFRQDLVMTLFDKGAAAIVPVNTTLNPNQTASFDIQDMRVGEITGWLPRKVKVSVYDDREGQGRRQELVLGKKYVAVMYNPLYAVMNEANSTLSRIIRKLNLIDAVDEQSSSGKLDIIIQFPYQVKSEARRAQAEQRIKDIEVQLSGAKYGIAYADGTEKITQLNRPAENNLLKQVEYLIPQLYGQLGITEEVMNGTADEKTMINYYNRTIEPLLSVITQAMVRTFITKTGRAQKQSVMSFRSAFQWASISDIAESADKMARNEILSANEIRQILGFKPSKDPKADELRNSNMPEPTDGAQPVDGRDSKPTMKGDSQNGT